MHLLHVHVAAAAHGRNTWSLPSTTATASTAPSLQLGLLVWFLLLLLLHPLFRRRKLQSSLRLELLQQLEVSHRYLHSPAEVVLFFLLLEECELRLLPPHLRLGLLLALPQDCDFLLHALLLAQEADGALQASVLPAERLKIVEEARSNNGNHAYLRPSILGGLDLRRLVARLEQIVVIVDGGKQLQAPHHIRRMQANVFGQPLELLSHLFFLVLAGVNHVCNDIS